MWRLAVTILAFAALACGRQDSSIEHGSVGAPPVASQGAMEAPKTPTPMPTQAAQPTVNPQSQSCLDLVGAAKYQEAIPACVAALKADPTNQQVKDALAKAQGEAAKVATAGEAAKAAAGQTATGAADQATSAAQGATQGATESATKGLTEKLGQ